MLVLLEDDDDETLELSTPFCILGEEDQSHLPYNEHVQLGCDSEVFDC